MYLNNIKTHILVVNSNDRNKSLYQKSNKFIYELPNDYKNITEIELINAYIPKSGYNIDSTNNTLDIKIINMNNNNSYNQRLIIPNGNYNEDQIINTNNLHVALNNIFKKFCLFNRSINNVIGCIFNHINNKYYFYINLNSNLTIHENSGPTSNYSKCFYFEFNFKGKDIVYDKYIVENFNNKIKTKKLIELKYDDYKCSSVGNTLGFLPKLYNNIIDISFNYFINNNLSNIIITFKNLTDLVKFYDLIILNNNLLNKSIYLVYNNEHFIIDLNINSVKLLDINYTNFDLCLQVYPLKDSNLNNLNLGNNVGKLFLPIISDNVVCFETDQYIMLDIPELMRYHSRSKVIQNAFVKIPLSRDFKMFEVTKPYGNLKIFRPPKGRLSKLNISFYRNNGQLYDFNGKELTLIFAITTKI